MSVRLLLSRRDGRTWAALEVGGRVAELHVEPDRRGARAEVGDIFEARVRRIDRDTEDVWLDLGSESARLPRSEERQALRGLREGASILVQVSAEGRDDKGPRVTTNPGLRGRYLVFRPFGRGVRPSRKTRLQPGFQPDTPTAFPSGGGWILRRAAAAASTQELQAEAQRLVRLWRGIEADSAVGRPPRRLWRDAPLGIRFLRDTPEAGSVPAVVDHDGLLAELRVARDLLPASIIRSLARYPRRGRLLEAEGLLQAVRDALEPVVRLPGGGRVSFEVTKAVVGVDVDAGSGSARQANLEASVEIPRQLRLRRLSGVAAVDFISGAGGRETWREILSRMREGLSVDPLGGRLVPEESLWMVLVARRRRERSLEEAVREAGFAR